MPRTGLNAWRYRAIPFSKARTEYEQPRKKGRKVITRDFRIDSLRGLMLVIMTIDHLGGPLEQLTRDPLGFASAAAGFVFLSGYMYALVYAQPATTTAALCKQSFGRAALIYRYHILCLLLLVLLSLLMPALNHYWKLEGIFNAPVAWSAATLFLVNAPKYFDILPMYIIFVLATPMLIWSLRRGRVVLVIATSISLWTLAQVAKPAFSVDALLSFKVHAWFFNLFAWQLVWTLGVMIGYYRNTAQQWLERLPSWLVVVMLAIVGMLFLARHGIIPPRLSPDGLALAPAHLGWLRTLNVLSILVLMAWVLRYIPVETRLPWLTDLGRASIQVFTFHLLVVYFTLPVAWRIRDIGGAPLYGLYTALCVASLTLPVYLVRQRRRRLARRTDESAIA